MKEITLTAQKLEVLLKQAFDKGEDWGVTYSNWFTPTSFDTLKKKEEMLNQLMSKL